MSDTLNRVAGQRELAQNIKKVMSFDITYWSHPESNQGHSSNVVDIENALPTELWPL